MPEKFYFNVKFSVVTNSIILEAAKRGLGGDFAEFLEDVGTSWVSVNGEVRIR